MDGLCKLTDLPKTIFETIGLSSVATTLPGRSLLPDRFEPAEYVLAEVGPNLPSWLEVMLGFSPRVSQMRSFRRSIRTNDYKYEWLSNQDARLFDVKNDPLELSNLIALEPEMAKTLAKQLAKWRSSRPAFRSSLTSPTQQESLDPDALENLKAIGYIR